MKGNIALAAVVAWLGCATSVHAVSCPERSPAAIAAVAAQSRKCQSTIAKEGGKYMTAKLKALGSCKVKRAAGSCPDAKTTEKIDKARNKSVAKITAACADDAVQAGLASSYASLTDDTVLSSCTLSQHSVSAELLSAISNGAMAEEWPATSKDRGKCLKELSKAAVKFFSSAQKTATKCIAKATKAGIAGDLAQVCVGSFDSGESFVAPTDTKTADKQAKLLLKTEQSIAKKCAASESLDEIKSIFACPGSASVADLQRCIACAGWDAVFDAIEQQHAESGVFVAHGPGALQLAVGTGTVQATALAGTKFLIEPGTYQEEVTIHQGGDGIALVGCGAASDNRPRIIPPVSESTGRGIQATSVNGLVFQSLDFFNQANDHIRVTLGNDIVFRDITGDGNRHTAYAVFPILSNNVLVELCKVRAQDDAPIYIGQSSTIVVRYNDVRDGVAGIEIENCGNAQVYGNYGTANTAGLLVFKDGNLPVQLSECHAVHHNLFENNNEPNFGTGAVGAVPTGTGILIISTDSTPYSYNMVRGNNTAGIVLTDQVTAGFNVSPGDSTVDHNYLINNVMYGNGTSVDTDRWPLPFGSDLVFLALDPGGATGNCQSGNLFNTQLGFAGLGVCSLPPPDPMPGCPAPPV